ncbi:MAG: hypothetical protein ABS81_02860 [Pseudonocardia sp. SCN 72-86]|nr:MAG: hypothetical protein ABS81_02860 [Pseudonocardia sp. SCN 72-86]
MLALALVAPGRVEAVDVPRPEPAPGEVLVAVHAAGLCQTDVHIRRSGDHRVRVGTILGHEIAGSVAEIGGGVAGWSVGDAVAVYPVWSCGRCRPCLQGRRNGCAGTGGRMATPPTPGISMPGGLAEFVRVPSHSLAGITGLDMAVAATMADAALSPYSSVRAASCELEPGSVVVVIGVGGLGSMAVQILRATTGAVVVALDVDDAALDRVRAHADHALLSDGAGAAAAVLALTDGYGAQVVLDFVGSDSTLALAADVVAPFGMIRVTGMAGGALQLRAGADSRLPRGATIAERLFSGTYAEFLDVLGLARRGQLAPEITRFAFVDGVRALDALEAGEIRGRAVLTV